MITEKTNESKSNNIKGNGVVYTPEPLAYFVAKKLVSYLNPTISKRNSIRVLDPSIGDGVLITSLLDSLDLQEYEKVEVTGFDIDSKGFSFIEDYVLKNYNNVTLTLIKQDFLEFYDNSKEECLFDVIIANPPYIRNQVLGSEKAQQISKIFNVKGKVDIYYVFMWVLSNLLSVNGVMATITSNRFLSIKSGRVIREHLSENLGIKEVIDLGDTKLFDGFAVLPALVFSKKVKNKKSEESFFKTIYEVNDASNVDFFFGSSIYEVLEKDEGGIYCINDRVYKYQVGELDIDQSNGSIWTISNEDTKKWGATVEQNTWKKFKEVVKTRVGIKSTADKVFIRDDWDELEHPPELLKELVTSQCANQFYAKKPKTEKKVLYPHVTIDGKNSVVNLDVYPRSKEYLELHREKLSSRKYLIDAGRAWYSLWVPHNPILWQQPKIVFSDITEKPKFWIDLEGTIVNGECYWMTLIDGDDSDLLWLCLAVANSSFIEKYYDYKFNNKLYSGKRRFIKQYVEQFPLPDPNTAVSTKLMSLAKQIALKQTEQEEAVISEIDRLVHVAFGVV